MQGTGVHLGNYVEMQPFFSWNYLIGLCIMACMILSSNTQIVLGYQGIL